MTFKNIFSLALVAAIISLYTQVDGIVEFQNVKCIPIDKEFADFEYCYIKAVNRSYKYISVKVNLFKIPITNVTVGVELKKKANGYKPFLYNISFDACKVMRSRSINPVVNYFINFFRKNSNFVHKCPFDHDLIVDKLDTSHMDNQLTRVLPMPGGEYGIFTTWSAYNKLRAHFDWYFKIENN